MGKPRFLFFVFVFAMFLKIAQQLRALVTTAADWEGHNRLALNLC